MFDKEFYPSPPAIAKKMLERISRNAQHFLEPSAGKGDLAEAIKNRSAYKRLEIDCIEQSPELCAILSDKGFSIVGHDWLNYDGVCYYDAIVMNPPFSKGDEHLLKAWDFLYDGEIVCLLNAQTIQNPCTKSRKRLISIIEEYGDIEYLEDCFSHAERKTDVNVALVYLKKETNDEEIDLWVNESAEAQVNDGIGEANMLAIRDNLGNMQHYYDQANIHMFKAFRHIRKACLYMRANGICEYGFHDLDKILKLSTENTTNAKAEFIRKHRNKAWHHVFKQMEFHKFLDHKQKNEFFRDIDRNGNIPFTKENIKGTLLNVFEQRHRLFEQSVANVFDELTRYYDGNSNYTEGWKSNDNYKVNKKLVFPYGCSFDRCFRKFSARYGAQIDIYNDLDRVLCVLTGRDFDGCETIGEALRNKFDILGYDVKSPFDNETESRFFHIKFYMKGTVHLKFKSDEHWELFNKTAAKGKAWLGQNTQSSKTNTN